MNNEDSKHNVLLTILFIVSVGGWGFFLVALNKLDTAKEEKAAEIKSAQEIILECEVSKFTCESTLDTVIEHADCVSRNEESGVIHMRVSPTVTAGPTDN